MRILFVIFLLFAGCNHFGRNDSRSKAREIVCPTCRHSLISETGKIKASPVRIIETRRYCEMCGDQLVPHEPWEIGDWLLVQKAFPGKSDRCLLVSDVCLIQSKDRRGRNITAISTGKKCEHLREIKMGFQAFSIHNKDWKEVAKEAGFGAISPCRKLHYAKVLLEHN